LIERLIQILNSHFKIFFSNYEKNVLGYNLRYTPVKWSIILDSFDLLHNPTKLSPEISILYSLGIKGMRHRQIMDSERDGTQLLKTLME